MLKRHPRFQEQGHWGLYPSYWSISAKQSHASSTLNSKSHTTFYLEVMYNEHLESNQPADTEPEMFENKVTWCCGRENIPSGFPAQWTPCQDGTNLKDEPGDGIQNIQKGLKRIFFSPSKELKVLFIKILQHVYEVGSRLESVAL